MYESYCHRAFTKPYRTSCVTSAQVAAGAGLRKSDTYFEFLCASLVIPSIYMYLCKHLRFVNAALVIVNIVVTHVWCNTYYVDLNQQLPVFNEQNCDMLPWVHSHSMYNVPGIMPPWS